MSQYHIFARVQEKKPLDLFQHVTGAKYKFGAQLAQTQADSYPVASHGSYWPGSLLGEEEDVEGFTLKFICAIWGYILL